MKIAFSASPSLTELQQVIDEHQSTGLHAHLIIGCDQNHWPAADVDTWLKTQSGLILGAVFPQIIYAKQHYEQGFICVSLDENIEWKLIDKLSCIDQDYDEPVAAAEENWANITEQSTLLVMADGMASRIAALIESLFFNFGLERNFVGGGAGSLSFEQKPCILCPDGFLDDVALLINLPLTSGVGVAHGWQPLSEPLKVTKSDRNIIWELDYKPAFSHYQHIIQMQSDLQITADNFFDIAKSYPFGILKLDAEMVVRDPLMPTEDGKGLVCVGEVPEDCFVKVLNGTPDNLIQAANAVKVRATGDWHRHSKTCPQLGLFIDCISRVLFLEDKMSEEIAQVADDYPLIGALTLGEIANNGQDYLEFYNKTAVLCILGKDD